MATGAYVGKSTAKKVKGIYIGASNISKKVKRAYVGAGGLSRLWWTAPLSYKNISINEYFYFNREAGPILSHNGNYLVVADAGGSSLVYNYATINKNGVCNVISRQTYYNSGDLQRISAPASSGSRIWSINGRKSGNYFDYVDNNLTQSSLKTGSYSLNSNNRWLNNVSFQDYSYAAFLGFSYYEGGYGSNTFVRISNSGVCNIIDAGMVLRGFVASFSNYVIVSETATFSRASKAINIQNLTTTSLNFVRYSDISTYCKNIGNKICFVTDYSRTANFMNMSFVTQTFALDDQYEMKLGAPYGSLLEDKWYFKGNQTIGNGFVYSIDINGLTKMEDNLLTLFGVAYYNGFDVFDNSLYYTVSNSSTLSGILKVY